MAELLRVLKLTGFYIDCNFPDTDLRSDNKHRANRIHPYVADYFTAGGEMASSIHV